MTFWSVTRRILRCDTIRLSTLGLNQEAGGFARRARWCGMERLGLGGNGDAESEVQWTERT